ncbi:MAG: histone deacetylase [Candidatus Anoxymicrobium japonicum]|uniref:Histone deacetylase n=1 Tax=Candidatus Anoxymicrobium japonicum TaxID=2013648 RepID=A0A2N3G542_9ACTN|nr:MAG: histone deacetylase [Candidatus Anoxymicrobium japonicum]
MAEVVIYSDPLFEKHDTGYGHPECPERLSVSRVALDESGLLETVKVVSPRDATVQEIELVHSSRYIEQVERLAKSGGGNLDMDTPVSPATYSAALKAAGAVLQGVDWCFEDSSRRAFCMVRPPGHHALPARGMGFCVFNNIAMGARYAMSRAFANRVMIVDWDSHHGNGTQDVFYEDQNVLYLSLHQYPHYPGTGGIDETGAGKGNGYTINLPFPAGTGEAHYLEAFERVVIPVAQEFKPDLVMVSAGYDSHAEDPLCSMRLIDSSYRKMTDYLVEFSEDYCDGRLLIILEGGYNLSAQAHSVVQTVAELAGIEIPAKDKAPLPTAYPEKAGDVVARLSRTNWS